MNEELIPFCVVFKVFESTTHGTTNVYTNGRATADVVTQLTRDFMKGIPAGVYVVSEPEGQAPRQSTLALRFENVLYIR